MTFDLQHGYYVALLALTACVMLKGPRAMKRTILTICGNALFSILLAASGLWPSLLYAGAMIAADIASLWIITARPAAKMQSIIGLTYVFQISTWVCYAASMEINGFSNMDAVWLGLTIPAIAQLVLVGGWLSGGRVGHYYRWLRPYTARAIADRQGVAR